MKEMPESKGTISKNTHKEKVYSEKQYVELEKELVLFKEKTYENLQQYKRLFEILEEETKKKQVVEKQLTSSQETISQLETKIIQLENKNKKTERELQALKNSKLGRLTKKYWAFRKRRTYRKSVVQGVNS